MKKTIVLKTNKQQTNSKQRKMRKRRKPCMCGGNLTPLQVKKMMGPRHFKIMPVPYVTRVPQMGRGHCCGQCGGDFLGIGKALSKVGKSIVSNPLRLAAGIGTLGLSETFLTPAQLIGDAAGVKPSKALAATTPFLTIAGTAAGAPALGKAAGFTSKALKMMGQGKRMKKGRAKKRKKHKK